MGGKKASLAIMLLATLLTAFAAVGAASAAAYTSGTVSGDQISYDGGTNWKSLSDAAAAGDMVGNVTIAGASDVTIPDGLKITGSVYNSRGVLLAVNGEQELSAENTNGIDAEGKGSNVNFRNLKSLTASSDSRDVSGINSFIGGRADVTISGKISASAGGSTVRTKGVWANGVCAEGGSYVKINGATGISATGLNASGDDNYSNARAINVNYGSVADISLSGSNADITAAGSGSGSHATGIGTAGSGSVDVTGVNDITVSAIGTKGDEEAFGIGTDNSSVGVSMGGSMTVKTTGDKAFGVLAEHNAKVNLSGMKAMDVSAASGDACGISATNSSRANAAMSGAITVDNANGNAHGIYAYGGSSAKVSGATDISVTANNSYYEDGLSSISATNGGNVDVAMSGKIGASAGGSVSYVRANGVYAQGGSYVKVSGATGISAAGLNASDDNYSDAYAISVGNGSVADISLSGSNADITAAGSGRDNYATGINTFYGGSADVTGVNDITVSATGTEGDEEAWGIDAEDSGVDVSMNGNMTVKTTGDEAYGVKASNAAVKFTGMKAMNVSADNGVAYGIDADESKASGSLGSMAVTASEDAYGISAKGSSVDIALANGMNVTSKGGDASGIEAGSSNVTGSLDGMTVKAANNAEGIIARGSGVKLKMGGDMNISSANGWADGILAYGYPNWLNGQITASSIDVSGVKSITVSGNTAPEEYACVTGAVAQDGSSINLAMDGDMNISNAGGNAYGLEARYGSALKTTGMKAMNVSSASGNAYGIRAYGGSVDVTMTGDMTVKGARSSTAIDAEDGSTVTVTGATRHKIAIDSEVSTDSVLRLSNGSTINVSNADVLNLGKTTVNSITAENYGSRSSSEDIVNASNSYLKGDVAFYESIDQSSQPGSLTVNLKDGSTLEGAANAYDGFAPGIAHIGAVSTPTGAINVNVFDTSKWLVTGDSNLGKGTLANNGTVAFSEDGAFKTVYVNKLAGTNGAYEMNTDGTNADQIIAETKDSSASGVIHASAKSGVAATYQKRVVTPFITVKNEESTSFTLAGGKFSLGAWNYVLKSGLTAGGETEWYLASDPQNPVSPLALAATAAVVKPDVWYLETNALYSQANSFNADREDTAVWGQAVYNKTEWDNAMSAEGAAAGLVNADGNEVTQKFYGLTGGIDKRIKTDKGQWFAGWMIGYGEGDLDFTGGDGDLDSFHTGLYTVYRTDNDWYLAALAKYNSYKTSVTARANNTAYDGEYTQNGWGLSFLAGKQFVKESGWYLEPQLELGWHRTAGADYELAGLPVDVESMTSLRARAGLGFGRKRVYDNGRSLEFFVRASVVKEFDGDTNVRFFADQTKTAFDPFKVDYSGTWGQYKLGLNYYAPDKGFTLHGALTYENGGDRESPIGLELGGSWNIGPKTEEETEK